MKRTASSSSNRWYWKNDNKMYQSYSSDLQVKLNSWDYQFQPTFDFEISGNLYSMVRFKDNQFRQYPKNSKGILQEDRYRRVFLETSDTEFKPSLNVTDELSRINNKKNAVDHEDRQFENVKRVIASLPFVNDPYGYRFASQEEIQISNPDITFLTDTIYDQLPGPIRNSPPSELPFIGILLIPEENSILLNYWNWYSSNPKMNPTFEKFELMMTQAIKKIIELDIYPTCITGDQLLKKWANKYNNLDY